MTRNREILAEVAPMKGGNVTFGDENQGRMQEVGSQRIQTITLDECLPSRRTKS